MAQKLGDEGLPGLGCLVQAVHQVLANSISAKISFRVTDLRDPRVIQDPCVLSDSRIMDGSAAFKDGQKQGAICKGYFMVPLEPFLRCTL